MQKNKKGELFITEILIWEKLFAVSRMSGVEIKKKRLLTRHFIIQGGAWCNATCDPLGSAAKREL